MAIAKAERLMNLALCLMNTRRPLSKRELRDSIEAYREITSDDSFNRMFERDKDDLRELGLVIETVEDLDGEIGYLARRDRNRLPEIALDAEEAAALGLAAKVWQQARLAGAASGALQKLRAAGCRRRRRGRPAQRPRAAHPRPRARLRAADAGLPRPPPGRLRLPQGQRRAPRAARRSSPGRWSAGAATGTWPAGTATAAPSGSSGSPGSPAGSAPGGAFTAEVPDHVDVRETVASWAGEGATATARIRLRRGSRLPAARPRRRPPIPVDADWDELEIPYGHGLDAWLVEFGPDVVVLEPAELRADVMDRLRAVAKGADGGEDRL